MVKELLVPAISQRLLVVWVSWLRAVRLVLETYNLSENER